MQSFFEFLLSVINHYHINGLHLFWDSLEWFFSLNKEWRNIFLPLLSKALWSKISCCYSILYSNLKQKKNTKLLLVELLTVTWAPCLLRHPIWGWHPTRTIVVRFNTLMEGIWRVDIFPKSINPKVNDWSLNLLTSLLQSKTLATTPQVLPLEYWYIKIPSITIPQLNFTYGFYIEKGR